MEKPSSRVHAFLEQALAEGLYEPGSKLPTERALSEQLGVPRSAVRDTLSVMEAQGQVMRRIGSGTYVSETLSRQELRGGLRRGLDMGERRVEASPTEIMSTRLVLEPRLAGLIIANATASDFERMDACNRKAEAADDFGEFEHWDAALHQALADATHNRLIIDIYRTVTEARDWMEWGDLKRRSLNGARRDAYRAEHRLIVSTLRARDYFGAERAIEAHLRTVRSNLFDV